VGLFTTLSGYVVSAVPPGNPAQGNDLNWFHPSFYTLPPVSPDGFLPHLWFNKFFIILEDFWSHPLWIVVTVLSLCLCQASSPLRNLLGGQPTTTFLNQPQHSDFVVPSFCVHVLWDGTWTDGAGLSYQPRSHFVIPSTT